MEEPVEGRGRTGAIRIVPRRIKRLTAGKQDKGEIISKIQGRQEMRKDGSEEHVEGKRKDQVTWRWGRKEQKVIEIKNA